MNDIYNEIISKTDTEDDKKQVKQIKELEDILVDLIKKMSSDSKDYNMHKELYNITKNRLEIMKQERKEKFDKIEQFVIETYKLA